MNNNGYTATAVILAAGSGSRMKSSLTKQRMTVLGETVLHRAARAFDECDEITDITVVVRADEVEFARAELSDLSKPVSVVVGGDTRAESAKIGFLSIADRTDFVAIHDAARCLVTPEMITRVLNTAYECGAATAAAPVFDTVKCVDGEGRIISTPARSTLRLATTPQAFSTAIYRAALEFSDDYTGVTDDNMLVERSGAEVFCVDLGVENIKITTMQDVKLAEIILEARKNV